MFQCIYPVCGGGLTFENLTIDGYNQAVYINQASANRFNNVNLSTYSGATGLTDNTPLKLCNSTWNWYEGGTIGTNGAFSIPAVLLCSDSTPGNFSQVILTYFENVLMDDAAFVYRAGILNTSVAPGFLVFRNITVEASTQSFFKVIETTPGYLGGLSNITFDNIEAADSTPAPLIEWDANSPLSGVFIKSSGAGTSLIQVDQGKVNTVFAASNGAEDSNVQIVDSSGNPVGGAATQNHNGFDYIADTTDAQRLRSDLKNQFTYLDTSGFDGPSARFTTSGTAFSSLALDPTGAYFGDGASFGFSSRLGATVTETMDVSFASLLPPTSVSGSATTGGSVPSGTYYYWLQNTADFTCLQSAPSLTSSGVVVSRIEPHG